MSELRKLKKAAEIIENLGDGRYELTCDSHGSPHLSAEDDGSKLRVCMNVSRDFEAQRYEIGFTAMVCEMGAQMNARELEEFTAEAGRTWAMVAALGLEKYTPSEHEYRQFAVWLCQRQSEQQAQTSQMGMIIN